MEIAVKSPFPYEALPRVWKWMDTFRDKVADDYAPQDLTGFMTLMGAKLDLPGYQTWSVSADGELVGLIVMERLSPWVGSAHWILKPDFHGKGVMLKASIAAVGQMFETGIGKLSFYPLAGNWAMFSLLTKLGAKKEGVLRSQTQSGGKPIDMHLYGLLKEEFEHAASNRASRGGIVDRRLYPGEQAEAAHLDHHAHAVPGDAEGNGPAPGVPADHDERSHVGIGADQDQCDGAGRPQLCGGD